MGTRRIILETQEYYHVYNRGVARLPIFYSYQDYQRFLNSLEYYQFLNPPIRYSFFLKLNEIEKIEYRTELKKHPKLVSIYCYALIPNHYHLFLKQEINDGIDTFMRRSINSYVKHINRRDDRVGTLFQGAFKATRVESNEQAIYLTKYIHLNPVKSCLITLDKLQNYKWSSLPAYVNEKKSFIDKSLLMDFFKDKDKYLNFLINIKDQATYFQSVSNIKIED